jgi:predicted Zn-dependent protease with MMP-like domain
MPLLEDYNEAARLLVAGEARAAADRLQGALAGSAAAGELPPAFEANARHLLGRALAACGDREGMTREWGRVLALDAAAARPPQLLTAEEFESAAVAALDELPQALLDELNGVAILIEDRPTPEMVADGLDPRVLGLYHGVPLNRRSASFGAPYADTIHLFSANLESVCPSREALIRQIRVTVLHETAHFFGYSEGQLRSMGLA